MKRVPTPETWVTLDIFSSYAREITTGTPKNPRELKDGRHAAVRLISEVVRMAAAPTHQWEHTRLGKLAPSKRIISAADVGGLFGAHSMVPLLDSAAAETVALPDRHKKTLWWLSPIAIAAAGVRTPKDTWGNPNMPKLTEPFVAQVAGYDFRAEQVFGTEGFICAIRTLRPMLDNDYAVLQSMFNDARYSPDGLREMAIPTADLTLLTTRGIKS